MLTIVQVRALNALAAVLPVTQLEVTAEDGTVTVIEPAGTGWMVDPPSCIPCLFDSCTKDHS